MKTKIFNMSFVVTIIVSTVFMLDVYGGFVDDIKTNAGAMVGIVENKKSVDLNKVREEYNNDEIKGFLSIPGTNINTLFAQGNDNKYYLRHTLKKEYNRLGSIFMDTRNTLDDSQINLYAHNSIIYDNAPFRGLTEYVNPEFAESNDIINIETDNWARKYQIVIVKQTNDQEHMALKSKNFDNHIKKLRKASIYNADIEVKEKDNLLVLQTCAMNEKKEIIVIVAKEIK